MKIVTVSDIHLDMNSKYAGVDLLPVFIQCLKSQEANLIIIAGDLCDNADDTIQVLDRLEAELEVKVLFIPGNHDIWVKQKDRTSWESYHLLQQHPSSLLDKPYDLKNGYVVIGEMGWYDYSFVKETIPYQTMIEHLEQWGDYKWTEWQMDDQQLNAKMLSQMQNQLNRYKDKKIILVHHFVPYKDFLSDRTKYMDWDLYNAFMGSQSAGDLINTYSNIEYVIFGHTHDRFGIVNNFYGKTVICSPLGYIAEPSETFFKKELLQSITIIELED
ncbi:metallophosphoesterase [Bacillus sp. AGMB 02131]|uniref:Metallophosphoesterase n=1 Tax=Peribacillus faecalis TaxID=2772559 RepID=A0A927CVU0_9BACI|nr:metallophosphoesterase [Peribacillus faecalis]MBD3108451.1 metallophosphoesterase [Peribacillus faecalis]